MPRPDRVSLTQDDYDFLESVLDSCKSENAMNLKMLDGFFAALICSPQLVVPSRYLPEIWGGDVGNHDQSPAVSPDLNKRVCATGVNDGKTACGFIAAGQCQQVCSTQADGPGRGYSNCRSGAGRSDKTSQVITVFLRTGE